MVVSQFSQLFISLIAAVGLGGILGAYFQSRFQHQKEIKEDIHQLKRARYGAILIQMLTMLQPQHLPKTQKIRPDLASIEDVKEELKTEMFNSILFASDPVVKAMAEFLSNPAQSSYIKTAAAMRKDLWSSKTSIDEDILKNFAD